MKFLFKDDETGHAYLMEAEVNRLGDQVGHVDVESMHRIMPMTAEGKISIEEVTDESEVMALIERNMDQLAPMYLELMEKDK